jgi:hypothetical protein
MIRAAWIRLFGELHYLFVGPIARHTNLHVERMAFCDFGNLFRHVFLIYRNAHQEQPRHVIPVPSGRSQAALTAAGLPADEIGALSARILATLNGIGRKAAKAQVKLAAKRRK